MTDYEMFSPESWTMTSEQLEDVAKIYNGKIMIIINGMYYTFIPTNKEEKDGMKK